MDSVMADLMAGLVQVALTRPDDPCQVCGARGKARGGTPCKYNGYIAPEGGYSHPHTLGSHMCCIAGDC
jgi:hypothetical protein